MSKHVVELEYRTQPKVTSSAIIYLGPGKKGTNGNRDLYTLFLSCFNGLETEADAHESSKVCYGNQDQTAMAGVR